MRYIKVMLIVFLASLVLIWLFNQTTNKTVSPKSKRLDCQSKSTTFEKVYDKNLTIEAQELLTTGNYIIKSEIEKSTYSKSTLFDNISKEDIQMITKKQIDEYVENQTDKEKKLLVSYYTRENDPDDPGKKTKKSKQYAGYLVFEFKLNNKTIYKIQTDFNDKKGKDIEDRIVCTIKSFLTIGHIK